jgi:hypothetical protein
MHSNQPRRDFLGGFGLPGLVGIAGCVSEYGSSRDATDVINNQQVLGEVLSFDRDLSITYDTI